MLLDQDLSEFAPYWAVRSVYMTVYTRGPRASASDPRLHRRIASSTAGSETLMYRSLVTCDATPPAMVRVEPAVAELRPGYRPQGFTPGFNLAERNKAGPLQGRVRAFVNLGRGSPSQSVAG